MESNIYENIKQIYDNLRNLQEILDEKYKNNPNSIITEYRAIICALVILSSNNYLTALSLSNYGHVQLADGLTATPENHHALLTNLYVIFRNTFFLMLRNFNEKKIKAKEIGKDFDDSVLWVVKKIRDCCVHKNPFFEFKNKEKDIKVKECLEKNGIKGLTLVTKGKKLTYGILPSAYKEVAEKNIEAILILPAECLI